ncbi:hypothetical protein TNCV_2357551 [Trichonephila clavipes]|nr:hypothetical protein TNCV_2357551 [Trichonephila clavipes]
MDGNRVSPDVCRVTKGSHIESFASEISLESRFPENPVLKIFIQQKKLACKFPACISDSSGDLVMSEGITFILHIDDSP